jgi:DNA-directed RNA polymerase sigma subunit (sigma70/sigma32)
MPEPAPAHLAEERRKEIFQELVEAQDREMSVAESRRLVAHKFGISEAEVRQIEREGLDRLWPPL